MKRKIAIAAALAASLLGTAACGSSGGDDSSGTISADTKVDGKGKTIKVWLMVDAQTGWKGVVDDASKRFTEATGANVTVEYQQWANVLTKLDASLAGTDVPDVVELGNTQFPKYVDAGAFAEVKKDTFENSATWLPGLSAPCDMDGKTYCVPYYAGARVLIYRKDLFDKAGVTTAPKTYEEFVAAADKVQAANKDPKFGAVYMPGRYWYAAMSWVKASGGDIAKKEGDKWVGQLSTPASQEGLNKWVDLVKKYSKADVTKDEADQYLIFSQANAGMFYGSGWEQGSAEQVRKDPNDPNSALVDTKVKGKLAAAPMPGIPSLLGGSNVGVPLKSQNQELAAQWVKYFTDSTSMKGLIKANALPNATAMLDQAVTDNPSLAVGAEAAKNSWAVPSSGKWADVEKASILQNMLSDILTGKKSVADASASADEQIAKTLNG